MDNEKNANFEESLAGEESEVASDTSARARNRTVMLTPEITGEVRARLAQDMQQGVDDITQPSPAAPAGSGLFQSPPSGSSYVPAGEKLSGGPAMQSQPGAVQPALQNAEGIIWTQETPIIGFLVAYDQNPNGAAFELRQGRLIVTSEAPGAGNYLVIKDGSVSPMHAIMRIGEDGSIQILDQLSEFGTKILRSGDTENETELSGDKSDLGHGDVVRFGSRNFHVCLVVRGEGDEVEAD